MFVLGYWDSVENHRYLFDSLTSSLGVEKNEDWYNIRLTDVRKMKSSGLLSEWYNTSLIK